MYQQIVTKPTLGLQITAYASKCFEFKHFSPLLCRHAWSLCTHYCWHSPCILVFIYFWASKSSLGHREEWETVWETLCLSHGLLASWIPVWVAGRKHGWAFSSPHFLGSATGLSVLNRHIPAVLQGTSRLDWHKGVTSPWKGVYW